MEVPDLKCLSELKGLDSFILYFSADWCGPCKSMHPHIERLSQKYSIKIFRVNVDIFESFAAKLEIRSIPTFVYMQNGEEVDRVNGAYPERLHELIKSHQVVPSN